MKLEFEKPRTPNFVKANNRWFSIKELSKEELDEYLLLVCKCLKDKWKKGDPDEID